MLIFLRKAGLAAVLCGLVGVFSAAQAADVATTLAKTQADPDELKKIKLVLKRYQQAKAVKGELKKSVKLALLDEEKNSEGELLLSNGRLRLEIPKPDPSTIIVNKNLIWVVSPGSDGLKTQVLKISSSSLKKQAKAPLAILMGRPNAWDQFDVQ